jgi:hypothetical protein
LGVIEADRDVRRLRGQPPIVARDEDDRFRQSLYGTPAAHKMSHPLKRLEGPMPDEEKAVEVRAAYLREIGALNGCQE